MGDVALCYTRDTEKNIGLWEHVWWVFVWKRSFVLCGSIFWTQCFTLELLNSKYGRHFNLYYYWCELFCPKNTIQINSWCLIYTIRLKSIDSIQKIYNHFYIIICKTCSVIMILNNIMIWNFWIYLRAQRHRHARFCTQYIVGLVKRY